LAKQTSKPRCAPNLQLPTSSRTQNSRAKRLRKLSRALLSATAQSATLRFAWQTCAVVAALLAVHVAVYAILSSSVSQRFE
jgi:hypothetical protein